MLAGAKLRISLGIKSKCFFLFNDLDILQMREKKGCDVQNLTTVIIRVGSDALWGHLARGVFTLRFEKKTNHYEAIIIFSLKCSS